jgi:hypothetical protein
VTLIDILSLPAVWAKLIGKNRITARGTRRLQRQMFERKRKIEILERLGLGGHAAENLYPPPPPPDKEKDA